MTQHIAPLVACVDGSEDIVTLLADALSLDGVRVAPYVLPVGWRAAPVIRFLAALRPDACVIDVALPDLPVVLTTTNRRGLTAAVGPVDGLALLGKPFDLDELSRAVRRARLAA